MASCKVPATLTRFNVTDTELTSLTAIEAAELLQQLNQRIYPYMIGGEGTAKETLDALAGDWNATFKKYGRVQ